MTEEQAQILRRVSWDAQTRLTDFAPMDALACWNAGWLTKDLHGCLSLTEGGRAALASAGGAK